MTGDVRADQGAGVTKPLGHPSHRGAAAWAIVISFACAYSEPKPRAARCATRIHTISRERGLSS